MRHAKVGSLSMQPNGVAAPHRVTFKQVSNLLAVASVLAVAPVFARDPGAKEVKQTNKAAAVRAEAQSESTVIPECMEKLNLTSQQQEQVREIIQNHDQSTSVVWKQFSDRYIQAICMETTLMAAIEDNLTEAQRTQVRNQRRRTAQHEKTVAATSTKVNQAPVKKDEENTKPDSVAEEGIAAAGITLTEPQEAAADKLQEKYHAQLRSLNRDIQGLHTRLVSLEADKLTEIEKVLTKEQLAQLRLHRQSAPAVPKVAISKNEPNKAE